MEEVLVNPDLNPALRFFGIKLYDADFWELLLRLAVNFGVALIIIGKIYQPTRKDSEYLFTYLVFSPIIFLVCHLFAKVDLSIGFAFGLFAVFSILRYRTTTIQVKELTYLFIVMALAVINALATKKVSYIELAFTNLFIICLTYFLEKAFAKTETFVCTVLYEKVENLEPQNQHQLIEDLETRMGAKVEKFEIMEADYLRDSAKLRVYCKSNTK